jgi:hypothetical protein
MSSHPSIRAQRSMNAVVDDGIGLSVRISVWRNLLGGTD